MTTKHTVLIVDDTPDNLVLLNGLLRHEYNVKAANNGHKALQIAAEAPPPDLILLDIMMPEIDGYTVCRKLKELEASRNIPVLFISALADTFDIVKAFDVGGVDYITKPFQPPEVMARVKTHLELYTARQELQTLLSKTLTGSVKMMIDLVALMQPQLMEQSSRVRRHARELSQLLAIPPGEAWAVELATMLFPVGCVGISQDILYRRRVGKQLQQDEQQCLAQCTIAGAEMIDRIPRMGKVAAIIRAQNTAFYQLSGDETDIAYMGSAILHMLLAYDTLTASGKDPASTLNALQSQSYPLRLIEALRRIVLADSQREPKRISFGLLQQGMVLAADLLDDKDNMIMAKGSELSANLIRLLKNYAENGKCRDNSVLVWEGGSI
jgi:response regulator RpfG family c-di-GMP phosphodiesterase